MEEANETNAVVRGDDILQQQQDSGPRRLSSGHQNPQHEQSLPIPMPTSLRDLMSTNAIAIPPTPSQHPRRRHLISDEFIGTNHSRSQSQSSDRLLLQQQQQQLPPTSPSQQRSLDPTGMFRNRGRRVIAGAGGMQQKVQHNNNHAVISSSSSQSSSPSPEKLTKADRQQHQRRRCHSSSSSLQSGEQIIFPQQQLPQHQQNRRSSSTRNDIPLENTSCGESNVDEEGEGRMMNQDEVTTDYQSSPPQSALPTIDPSSHRDQSSQKIDSTAEVDNLSNLVNDFVFDNDNNEGSAMGKSNIMLNRSHEEQHSPSSDIGSTVSVMGSIVGDNITGKYDNERLLAVRRRMMQDVEEIQEGEIDDINYCDDEEETGSAAEMHDENDLLNVSLECNADTDTSLLEDYPLNNSALYPVEQPETIVSDDGNSEASAEILHSNHGSMNPATTSINTNNTKRESGSGSGGGDGIGSGSCSGSGSANESAETRKEQESPFRAAFRRSAQEMSNRLPPLSTQMLSERLTPNRFQLASASSAIDKAATTASLLPQFARQCFSFEDTTIDDDTFFVMPEHLHAGGDGSGGHYHPQATHKYYGLSGVASFATIDEGGDTSTKRNLLNNAHPPQQSGLSSGELDSPFRVIRHARTWNHHGQSHMGETINSQLGAKDNITYLNGNIRHASSFDPWSPKSGLRKSSEMLRTEVPGAMHGAVHNRSVSQASEAKDWKKIETERGDAIDMLAFMVEQSLNAGKNESVPRVSFCQKCQENQEIESTQFSCSDCFVKVKRIANSIKEIGEEAFSGERITEFDQQARSDAIDILLRSHEFALEMMRSSLSASNWLQSIGCSTAESVNNITLDANHALDDFALRARLRSAEQFILTKEGEISRLNDELTKCRAEIGRLKSSGGAQTLLQPIPLLKHRSILSDSSSDSSTDSDAIDNVSKENDSLVLCPSRPTSVKLTDSQDESFTKWEKNIEAQMNLESRKEILLLKAALEKAQRTITALEKQKTEPFLSDIEPINASSDEGDTLIKIAKDIENKDLEVSMNNGDDEVPAEINLNDPALEKELEEYRRALIVTLENKMSARAGSVTSLDDPQIEQEVSKSTSSELASDRKMINVRMIDGENFSTEWGDLVDLPPPPDHDLHSPIVDAILSKWSGDDDTRLSLIQWIENILSGANIDAIPSLKLSGLDHQLRDGFVMHVLPLLLRRKDVHVHLTSRAHRQTTYDIAVSVTPTAFGVQNNKHDTVSEAGSEDVEFRQRQQPRESKHHLMAFHATKSGASIKDDTNVHRSPMPFWSRTIPGLTRTPSNAGSISTAVTTPISNRTPSRGPHIQGKNRFTSLLTENMKKDGNSHPRDENSMPTAMAVTSPSLGDDISVGSSVDESDNRSRQGQSTIMGSISGALGLLSRRKPSPVEKGFQGASHSVGHNHLSALHTPTRKVISNDEEHPYHRVVSAPPGKIGISFVEYHGHAMVSNVSEDSPLVGWVFPSDVLVAIDDVPVSGLPTREIVKLLTNRVHQQRNLRMVSAVAMNEPSRRSV